MRLKKLTCGMAVAGLSAGMVVGLASAAGATSTTLYPFFDNSLGANTAAYMLVGSTDPGNAGSQLCLNQAANAAGNAIDGGVGTMPANASYNGKVNGSVINAPTIIDQLIALQDATPVSVCVGTAILSNDAGSSATETDFVKHKATLTAVLTADVQSGILANSNTIVRVHKDAAQVVSVPGGATVFAGSPLAGSTSVDFKLKNVTVKTKSSLNTAACEDVDSVVNLGIADDGNGDRTQEINAHAAETNGATHTYSAANAATKNVITIRQCAQNSANVPGKPGTTAIKLVGTGTASLDFIVAQTSNPRTWDTTRGSTCSDSKATVTVGAGTYGARVMNCKGDYGQNIPFVISVRGIKTAGGTDPKGLVHYGDPVPIAGASITVT